MTDIGPDDGGFHLEGLKIIMEKGDNAGNL